jgi:hypothetical protein
MFFLKGASEDEKSATIGTECKQESTFLNILDVMYGDGENGVA